MIECEAARNLLRTRNIALLQQLTCGFSGQNPLVCCKQLGRNVNDNTDRNPAGEVETNPDVTSPKPQTPITESFSRITEPIQQENGLLRPPNCGFTNITNYKVVGGSPAKAREFY